MDKIAPERIRGIRKRMGLTQTEFAKKVGVSYATVNRWERGHTKPYRIAYLRLLEIEKAS